MNMGCFMIMYGLLKTVGLNKNHFLYASCFVWCYHCMETRIVFMNLVLLLTKTGQLKTVCSRGNSWCVHSWYFPFFNRNLSTHIWTKKACMYI